MRCLIKLDALRELDGAGVVDGDGGAAHVRLPRVGAALAAAARRLLAAERAAHLRAVGRDVHVHDAAVGAVRPDPLQRYISLETGYKDTEQSLGSFCPPLVKDLATG